VGSYRCPVCDEPVLVTRQRAGMLIGLHRDSRGKACPAAGRDLLHYRWKDLLRAIYGVRE
jgi:hypothetical protein